MALNIVSLLAAWLAGRLYRITVGGTVSEGFCHVRYVPYLCCLLMCSAVAGLGPFMTLNVVSSLAGWLRFSDSE